MAYETVEKVSGHIDRKDLWTGTSVWADTPMPHIPVQSLDRDLTTDVCIIGAGISGAITAQALAADGFSVVLLDRRPPLHGSTSATTALLQYEIDTPILKLRKQVGQKNATRAWQRSKLALDALAAKVMALDIDCDMERRCSLYLAGDVLDAKTLRKENDLRCAAGLHSQFLDRNALAQRYGIERAGAVLSFDSLTANPLQLAAGFLLAAQKHGAEIYSPVTVTNVDSRSRKVIVTTEDGPTVTARHVVYATGYEMPDGVDRSRYRIHSTYAIATKPQPQNLWPGKCLVWEASDPYLYVRTLPDGRVLCGGEDEAFGDPKRRDALLAEKTAKLEHKLRDLFPEIDATADYSWCGSFGVTPTGLPTIGCIDGTHNVFAILAFGGNGITFSSLAAQLLCARLTGRGDIDAKLFSF